MRRKPGAHLSREGIELARLVGSTSGPFSLVVTSTIPRAVETAIAMGFEVNETLDALGHFPVKVFDETGWPNPFARIAQVVAAGGEVGDFAEEQARLWRSVVEKIPDSQQALIITHGCFVELGAIASMPEADHKAWGDAIGYCEGVRLSYDGDSRHGQILRVPEEYHLIEN